MRRLKKIGEMNTLERAFHSLNGKTLCGLLTFVLSIGLIAAVFGISVYSDTVMREYRLRTWQMSRAASQILDLEEVRRESELVIKTYDALSRRERKQLSNMGAPELTRFNLVRDEGFERTCATLRWIQRQYGGMAAFIAFIDTSTNRRVFITDSDPKESSFCPPGYWDEYDEATVDALLHGKEYFIDRLYNNNEDSNERMTATTINMEPYGYRCTAGTLLFEINRYPVLVMFDTDMNTVFDISQRFFLQFLGIMAVLTLIFVLLARLQIRKTIVEPINELAEAANAYSEDRADGIFDAKHFSKLRIHTGDELEMLADSIKTMESDLGEYVENLTTVTAEKERISAELDLARRIQEAMLPHVFPPFPNRKEFDIYAVMDPAKEVGGDFYDFFLIDEDHLGLVIADVSGKGVPAALFMTVSKIILQSCAMLGKSVAEILDKTNEALCSNNDAEMFITAWVGILEISTGKLTAGNAGHEYPVIRRANGSYELLKDKHSFMIGMLDEAVYRDYELQLQPGDCIFVYTDGLPEATNAQNELFGTERMVSALNEEPDLNPEALLQHMHQTVDSFVGSAPQFDDLTMLCIRYDGPPPVHPES